MQFLSTCGGNRCHILRFLFDNCYEYLCLMVMFCASIRVLLSRMPENRFMPQAAVVSHSWYLPHVFMVCKDSHIVLLIIDNANCTSSSKTLPLSEWSSTTQKPSGPALGTLVESLLGSVSMHVMYGQPLPNPLLAAKKHHSIGHGDNAAFVPTIMGVALFPFLVQRKKIYDIIFCQE